MSKGQHVVIALHLISFALLPTLTVSQSSAEQGKAGVNSVFGPFGYDTSSDISDKTCVVSMTVDQKEFIRKVPILQKMGLINNDIRQSQINTMRNSLSIGFAMQLAPLVTHELYKDNDKIDNCKFTQFIKSVDEYGNDKVQTAFSYTFNRSLDKRINWDKFENENLMKVAPEFRFHPEIMQLVAREQE